jgi:hypothetical protein
MTSATSRRHPATPDATGNAEADPRWQAIVDRDGERDVGGARHP